jgi:hypothetical protein
LYFACGKSDTANSKSHQQFESKATPESRATHAPTFENAAESSKLPKAFQSVSRANYGLATPTSPCLKDSAYLVVKLGLPVEKIAFVDHGPKPTHQESSCAAG